MNFCAVIGSANFKGVEKIEKRVLEDNVFLIERAVPLYRIDKFYDICGLCDRYQPRSV